MLQGRGEGGNLVFEVLPRHGVAGFDGRGNARVKGRGQFGCPAFNFRPCAGQLFVQSLLRTLADFLPDVPLFRRGKPGFKGIHPFLQPLQPCPVLLLGLGHETGGLLLNEAFHHVRVRECLRRSEMLHPDKPFGNITEPVFHMEDLLHDAAHLVRYAGKHARDEGRDRLLGCRALLFTYGLPGCSGRRGGSRLFFRRRSLPCGVCGL